MKNKILIFTVGLFAGLTFGVLFSVAIKELLIQFKELHLSLNKINLKQSELSQRLDSIQGKLVPDAKKVTNTNNQSIPKTPAQNQQKNTARQDSIKSSEKENVASSTLLKNDTDIVVMTNQLISVLSVHLKNKDSNAIDKTTQKNDSTIAAMSDVADSKGTSNYRIEFWKSPLNYKGYKMSIGKIVLYGINPDIPVNLTLDEGSYYLLVNHGIYHVDFTDDYRPFEKVTDKNVLKKLGI